MDLRRVRFDVVAVGVTATVKCAVTVLYSSTNAVLSGFEGRRT